MSIRSNILGGRVRAPRKVSRVRRTKGNWEPVNIKSITNNVALVFRSGTIEKLNGVSYRFIISHMGFIAHYSVIGFRQSYSNLKSFARHLQTSEYSSDVSYNSREARRQESDSFFSREYGKRYTKSVAETMRNIIKIARDYSKGNVIAKNPSKGLRAQVQAILDKHRLKNKFSVQSASFSDLTRGGAKFVKIKDWKAYHLAETIKDEVRSIKLPNGDRAIATFSGAGIIGNPSKIGKRK